MSKHELSITLSGLTSGVSEAELREAGRAARSIVSRADQAVWKPVDRDPVAILEAQNATRLSHLAPVRLGRMLQSPFAFFRGAAAVMAGDLADQPVSGARPLICGDAHIANFGLFATPERRQTFELNDFDEASTAPWEWDVKRLATSIWLGGRETGLSRRDATRAAQSGVQAYREAITYLMDRSALERFYAAPSLAWLTRYLSGEDLEHVHRAKARARLRTSDQVLERISEQSHDGSIRIVAQPPIMVHSDDAPLALAHALHDDYLGTVRTDIALLLAKFRLVDVVLRVVGVGSVGTRCYLMLYLGPKNEPLFLQAKEAAPSVLETHGGAPNLLRRLPITEPYSEGFRVVTGQRVLQTASDPFLGYFSHAGRDYYVRQFRDMKGSVELTRLNGRQFEQYVRLCGALLARGHGQSPAAAFIAGYLGKSDRFDRALAAWAEQYARQTGDDFEALNDAAAADRVRVAPGV